MNKPNLEYCFRLLQDGFSLLTVGENKTPNFSWKPNQKQQITKAEFEKRYNYAGGIFLKSGDEMKPTVGVGIITGFNNLEVLDIDLKVFKNLKQQQDFWNELLAFWKDNIDDFEDKFTIYKTVSGGYHVLYRCEKIEGNKKIAVLEGMAEAVIESRGVGGYVFIYDKKVCKLSYSDVQEISIHDRETLWDIARHFHYVEEKEEKPEIKKVRKVEYSDIDITPWEDFCAKESLLSVVGEDFEIVRNISDRYIIKRHGSQNATSGSIFKSTDKMYLFSTGTIYPHEKLVNAFEAYTFKHHNGNFSESAKSLYQKGYGSRKVKPLESNRIDVEFKPENLVFPIDIFPKDYQKYIIECNRTLSMDIDFMGCALLWLASVIIGNSMVIEVKKGWIEKASLWMALVGKAGIGKTPSIKMILRPLLKINNREISRYMNEADKYEVFKTLSKEEKERTEQIQKPRKTQFIANDITIEALVDLHEENKNAVGVFKDELAGWLKDMNKYRAGSDLEFWLSTWSGDPANFNRLSRKGSFVQNPFIPVLGGIQPNILDAFYTDENKDNGFVDRILLCYPNAKVEEYNENEMSQTYLDWYDDAILHFYNSAKNTIQLDEQNEIKSTVCMWSSEAKKEWIRIFNKITQSQNSDFENEYIKSMYPKQKSYIPRFALLINAFNYGTVWIEKDSILKAERLSNYFIEMAKKIKVESAENNDIKKVIGKDGADKKKSFEAIYFSNKEINRTKIAELLGVSRQTILSWIKELDKCTK
jgi:hypothetical protein